MTAPDIRQLSADQWETFRDFRLQALGEAEDLLGSTVQYEQSFTEKDWRARISGPGCAIFGVFKDNALIASARIKPLSDDLNMAVVSGDYVAPSHRGRGLMSALHKARLQWIAGHSNYKTVCVQHRARNEASRRAILSAGFRLIKSYDKTWPDGTVDKEFHYELTRDEITKIIA